MRPLLSLEFTVFGLPAPQGSMRAFLPKGCKRPVLTADNTRTKPWRQEIAGACYTALGKQSGAGPHIPIRIELRFFFPRPKSLKKSVLDKTTKPDLDKLCRACLDALTGIAFDDDSQVTEIHACKLFGMPPRMEIKISEADVPPAVAQTHQPVSAELLPF